MMMMMTTAIRLNVTLAIMVITIMQRVTSCIHFDLGLCHHTILNIIMTRINMVTCNCMKVLFSKAVSISVH